MQKIIQELNAMVAVDQKIRMDTNSTEGDIQKLDQQNTKRLKEIVQVHGWLTKTKVGKEASNAAWILVQHSDHDPKFQEYCLNLMKKSPKGEVNPKNIAYLEDRISVAKKGMQKYGTQFEDKGDYLVLRPVENLDDLDNLRKEMGLEPIAEHIEIISEALGVMAYMSDDDARKISQ